MEISKPKYFPALSGLRVILASMVFIYHYFNFENHNLSFAQIAVVLKYRMTAFFVLSGFVVMYSLIPKERLTLKEYGRFILTRILRLLPLYLLLLGVPYIQVGIPALPVFLTNITLTKGFFKELFFSGIGPAWSLTPEITFYFLAPLILNYIPKIKQFILSYLVALLTGIVLTVIGYYLIKFNYNPYGFFADLYFTLDITFFGRATDFYVGMFLAWIIYHYTDKEPPYWFMNKKTYIGIFMVILVSYMVHYFNYLAIPARPVVALICLHFFLPIAVGYFLWGLITENSALKSFLSLKWMVNLGNGAYGFYLMHTSWVQYKISKINILPDGGFFLIWLVAIVFYYTIEKPSIMFLRKKLSV